MALAVICLGGVLSGAAQAQTPVADPPAAPVSPILFSLDFTLEIQGVASGGLAREIRRLDTLSLSLDADLERAVGWSGATAHLEALNSSGEAPGELVGALQGVNANEVAAHRLRLYQAWIEQAFAGDRANLRLGFSDLSGEFGVVDSAGFMINPSFGMAPEFAASGAAAFPSTALGARLRLRPSDHTYLQAAVANARTGVPGEDGGADFSFDDGEIVLAEAGWTGAGKVAAGYWRLTDRQDDLFATGPTGDPETRILEGAYLLAEHPIGDSSPGRPAITGFVRAGVSGGGANPFGGSWQAGVVMAPALSTRPQSSLSAGVAQARLSSALRQAGAASGLDTARDETVFELTYSDLITPNLRIQPDLQYVRRPGGDRALKDALVLGLRLNLAF